MKPNNQGTLNIFKDEWLSWYPDKMNLIDNVKRKFVSQEDCEFDGFQHTLYKQLYIEALGWKEYRGSSQNFSNWLCKKDIINAFKYFGLSSIEIGFDDEKHPLGPCMTFAAFK